MGGCQGFVPYSASWGDGEAASNDKEAAAKPRPKRKPWRRHVQRPCDEMSSQSVED